LKGSSGKVKKDIPKVRKYLCRSCGEEFDIKPSGLNIDPLCPRCSGRDIEDLVACKIGVGPPPWDFACQGCGCRFSVQSPSGPDEVRLIGCPACGSKGVKWLALGSEACPSGG